MTYYIKADQFFMADELKPAGYLAVVDGKFGDWQENEPADAEIKDYTGYSIAPGLVDTHIHGFAGQDVMDNSAEGLKIMSKALLSAGVTSFLPTTLTAPFKELEDICATIADTQSKVDGAKIQGIFFEGPFFTEEHKGAQNPAYMKNPDVKEFDAWQVAAKGLLKKIALAPEREGVVEFTKALKERGVTVALGHSNATYDDAKAAVEAGASMWVHAYNGMRGLNHREPGMVGAVFNLKNTVAELICDGYHVHPVAAQLLIDHKGPDAIALITDCMSAGGQPDGDYMLGEYPVVVENGTARLKDGGNLAGSILQLKDAVKHVIDWGIVSPEEAIRMATLVPAKSVGIEHSCGSLSAGHPADFIVLDKDYSLQATYVDGVCGYQN